MKQQKVLANGMPYAVIMATGGVAVVAHSKDIPLLAEGLLAVAVILAVGIPLKGVWRHRDAFRAGWGAWLAIGPADEYTGLHTVPLGLAVLSSALAVWAHGESMPALLNVAELLLVLAWLLTGICVGGFLWSLGRFGVPWARISGAWFLVPAAILGASVATSDTIASTQSLGNLLVWGGAILGTVAYLAVAAGALARIHRFGLGGVPQSPWWIAMGCAGFAALALGRAAEWQALSPATQHAFLLLMTSAECLAVLLLIPIVFFSARFLLFHCRFRHPASWPPTFSTSVFALSALQAGALLHAPSLSTLGSYAGWAALGLWLVTAGWQVGWTVRYAFSRICSSDC